MRNVNDIKSKIDEYLLKLENESDPEMRESLCRVIDSLLWVLEDNSGAAI